jgi:hypothetical protein
VNSRKIFEYKFEIGDSVLDSSVVRQPKRLQDDVSWLCTYWSGLQLVFGLPCGKESHMRRAVFVLFVVRLAQPVLGADAEDAGQTPFLDFSRAWISPGRA